jgi:hypothetical protein
MSTRKRATTSDDLGDDVEIIFDYGDPKSNSELCFPSPGKKCKYDGMTLKEIYKLELKKKMNNSEYIDDDVERVDMIKGLILKRVKDKTYFEKRIIDEQIKSFEMLWIPSSRRFLHIVNQGTPKEIVPKIIKNYNLGENSSTDLFRADFKEALSEIITEFDLDLDIDESLSYINLVIKDSNGISDIENETDKESDNESDKESDNETENESDNESENESDKGSESE